jgi:predicted alpha/beta superfamily hydrolase
MIPCIYLSDDRDGDISFHVPNPIHSIPVPDWNRDLSPWPMKAVFGKEDFGGEADAFLSEVLKETDRLCPDQPVILAGYSLAGLFALYACTKTDRFAGCISASGSLWFEGFRDYLRAHPVHCDSAVLSLGRKEAKSRNPILSTIQTCTEETERILSEQCSVKFILQEGGHFADIGARISEDILCLDDMMQGSAN